MPLGRCWACASPVIDRVRQAPFHRLQALLDILADAPEILDEYCFALPGPDGVVEEWRLDEIALPAGF
ncbi:hypothetical protein [Nonomuraea sp. KM90]|uniref:hypothetical protein n=1 Tax=Nonomuraea sp. KM90 TaxID=3457428 RepID=UPI003FCCA558